MKDDNILVLLKSSSIVVGATVNTRLRPENEPTSVLRLPPRLPRLKLEPKPLSELQRETLKSLDIKKHLKTTEGNINCKISNH